MGHPAIRTAGAALSPGGPEGEQKTPAVPPRLPEAGKSPEDAADIHTYVYISGQTLDHQR